MLVEDSSTLKNKQREQIIHTETLNMMAKYQLIFLKMETHMRKVALTIKLKYFKFPIRTNQQRLFAYRKIKQASIISNRQYEIVYLDMNQKLKQMETLFSRRKKQNIIFAFQKIRFQFPKNKNEDIKKSFLKVIASKDAEIKNLHKKEQEILENINMQRSREQELQTKLKQKDIQLQQLELDARKNTCNRTIDSKLRNLELENQEMQDRVVGTEDSVNLFIREMNDLLDSHEISTNLGFIQIQQQIQMKMDHMNNPTSNIKVKDSIKFNDTQNLKTSIPINQLEVLKQIEI